MVPCRPRVVVEMHLLLGEYSLPHNMMEAQCDTEICAAHYAIETKSKAAQTFEAVVGMVQGGPFDCIGWATVICKNIACFCRAIANPSRGPKAFLWSRITVGVHACRGGGGLCWVGTGPHTGGDWRPARPSLHGNGPRFWVSGSKAERTRTTPMDHTAAQVSGRCCHGAGVCGRARSGNGSVLQARRVTQ